MRLRTPRILQILPRGLYHRAKRVGSPRMPRGETGLESRMREIRTSGLMSGSEKPGPWPGY
jgi:hypothetical protein